MRLIFKITIFYVLISLIVFLVGAVITYEAMDNEIKKEQRLFLMERLSRTILYIEKRKPNQQLVKDKMVITPLETAASNSGIHFSDTLVMHATLERIEPHILLRTVRNVDGKPYEIVLFDLIIESDDIADGVQQAMIKTYLLLLVAVLILGFVSSYFVFKPFRVTLSAIKGFSIKEKKPLEISRSSTREFRQLNQFILEMTDKVRKDYQALKEFSENASHEMQTPLSIAQGKLELLMDSDQLSEPQMNLISSALQALQRLSKLGNSLALLAKIENREFSNTEQVDLSKILNTLLFDFKELIELKCLRLETEIEAGVVIQGNQVLMEILLTNLLNNAIRHNEVDGHIRIELNDSHICFENTGQPLKYPPNEYFNRFRKREDHPESSGLGLSIAKKICDEHGFEISYQNEEKVHTMTVRFRKNTTSDLL